MQLIETKDLRYRLDDGANIINQAIKAIVYYYFFLEQRANISSYIVCFS
jgi:hypothetical protein